MKRKIKVKWTVETKTIEQWKSIYGLDTEEGRKLAKDLIQAVADLDRVIREPKDER